MVRSYDHMEQLGHYHSENVAESCFARSRILKTKSCSDSGESSAVCRAASISAAPRHLQLDRNQLNVGRWPSKLFSPTETTLSQSLVPEPSHVLTRNEEKDVQHRKDSLGTELHGSQELSLTRMDTAAFKEH